LNALLIARLHLFLGLFAWERANYSRCACFLGRAAHTLDAKGVKFSARVRMKLLIACALSGNRALAQQHANQVALSITAQDNLRYDDKAFLSLLVNLACRKLELPVPLLAQVPKRIDELKVSTRLAEMFPPDLLRLDEELNP
jgi:hypothetical protein